MEPQSMHELVEGGGMVVHAAILLQRQLLSATYHADGTPATAFFVGSDVDVVFIILVFGVVFWPFFWQQGISYHLRKI